MHEREDRNTYSNKDQSLLHFTCLMAGHSVNFSSLKKIVIFFFFFLSLELWSYDHPDYSATIKSIIPYVFPSVYIYIYIYDLVAKGVQEKRTRVLENKVDRM